MATHLCQSEHRIGFARRLQPSYCLFISHNQTDSEPSHSPASLISILVLVVAYSFVFTSPGTKSGSSAFVFSRKPQSLPTRCQTSCAEPHTHPGTARCNDYPPCSRYGAAGDPDMPVPPYRLPNDAESSSGGTGSLFLSAPEQ